MYHDGAGVFYLHIIYPFSYYAADLGACNSYDCDWNYSYLPGYLVASIATGGCSGDPYGFCGFFCLLRHTHAAYAGWQVGACYSLMIVMNLSIQCL